GADTNRHTNRTTWLNHADKSIAGESAGVPSVRQGQLRRPSGLAQSPSHARVDTLPTLPVYRPPRSQADVHQPFGLSQQRSSAAITSPAGGEPSCDREERGFRLILGGEEQRLVVAAPVRVDPRMTVVRTPSLKDGATRLLHADIDHIK